MYKFRSLALASLAALGMVAAGAASAAPGPVTICVDDPSNAAAAVCAVDGGLGDFNPNLGEVTLLAFGGQLGLNFSSALANATAEPTFGGPSLTGFHFDTFVNGGPGSIVASISQTGLMASSSGPTLFSSDLGGNLAGGAGVSYQVYADDSNTLFGTGTLVGSGAFNGTSNATSTGTASLDGEYSLTAFVTFTHLRPNATSSINMSVEVPEPSILALLGLGFAGLGVAGRRGRKTEA
jgi:hypothetical protein